MSLEEATEMKLQKRAAKRERRMQRRGEGNAGEAFREGEAKGGGQDALIDVAPEDRAGLRLS